MFYAIHYDRISLLETSGVHLDWVFIIKKQSVGRLVEKGEAGRVWCQTGKWRGNRTRGRSGLRRGRRPSHFLATSLLLFLPVLWEFELGMKATTAGTVIVLSTTRLLWRVLREENRGIHTRFIQHSSEDNNTKCTVDMEVLWDLWITVLWDIILIFEVFVIWYCWDWDTAWMLVFMM